MSFSSSEILPQRCEFLHDRQAGKFMCLYKGSDGVTSTVICRCLSVKICYHRLCFKICTVRNETVKHSLFQAACIVFLTTNCYCFHSQVCDEIRQPWLSFCRSVQAEAASFDLSSARESRRRKLQLFVRKLCTDSADSDFEYFVFGVCA